MYNNNEGEFGIVVSDNMGWNPIRSIYLIEDVLSSNQTLLIVDITQVVSEGRNTYCKWRSIYFV